MRRRAQNLSDGRLPLWRHGRTWIFGYRFAIEWLLPGKALGVSIDLGGFSIRTPLASLYVSSTRRESFGARELSIYWNDGCLWICHPFERDGGLEVRSSDPWWKKAICLHVVDWLIGRARYEDVKELPFEAIVPMPEGSYKAIATPSRATWRRRWYWPDRVRDSVWLEIPGGIPHSGKGENSWDCGDDGLYGIGGDTIEDAIANAVRTSLRNRRRYGNDSKGTGAKPLRVVNGSRFAARRSKGVVGS